MRTLAGFLFAGLMTLCVFTWPAFAQQKTPEDAEAFQRDPALEQPVLQELEKKAPKAVDTFKAATAALDRNDLSEAVLRYRDVLTLAPDFDPALRRLGYALASLGQRGEGLKMTQKALEINRSVDNLMGHAFMLAALRERNAKPTDTELSQALALAREGIEKEGWKSVEYVMGLAEIAAMSGDAQTLDEAAKHLEEKFPNVGAAHYYIALSKANRNDLSGAKSELQKAESMGLSHQDVAPLLTAIEEAEDSRYFGLGAYVTYFYIGAAVVLVWALGLFALFVAGKTLSSKTMHYIETSDPNDITGEGVSGFRKLYRRIVSIAGVYYFISQPVVMLLVIVVTAGVILGFMIGGTLPIKLLLIVAFVGLATLFVMVKSLFVRVKTEDPGRALTREEAPGLWKTVDEVAESVKTRPVNEIRITPGTDLAVYERGGIRKKMSDKAERILILGTATLNDFSQNAFRAVLAHEYGHFSNRDTAGGDIAYRVNEHIFRLAEAMGESGTATVYNIGFQFLRLYHFLFRRIAHGATRLQEILADRVAVHQYGAAAFHEGLTHVIRREIEFNHVAESEISSSRSARRAMQNLYDLAVDKDTVQGQLDVQFRETINRATTEDDTHPSPADRFKLAEKINSREGFMPVEGKVWDLFADREAIVSEMNNLILENIRARYGG